MTGNLKIESKELKKKPRQKLGSPGRPVIIEGGYVRTTISLSRSDVEKLRILGGSAWIRKAIREAKTPAMF